MQDFLESQNSNILAKNQDNFFLENALFVVATPIGNILDITLRAIDILKKCDFVICEDSRVSARLLEFLKIKKPFIIYNDHSDEATRFKILDLIKTQQKSLALISDAGTPLISDPGYKLVRFLIEHEVEVKSVPGPCSVIAALSICGIESDRFLFAGFVPHLKVKKEKLFKELVNIDSTLIFFESANRVATTLETMLVIFGNRKAAIARELTKLHEEVRNDNLENLVEFYQTFKVKGEIVILLSKPVKKGLEVDLAQMEKDLKAALKNMKPKEAVSLIADNHHLSKKLVYQKMLEITTNNRTTQNETSQS